MTPERRGPLAALLGAVLVVAVVLVMVLDATAGFAFLVALLAATAIALVSTRGGDRPDPPGPVPATIPPPVSSEATPDLSSLIAALPGAVLLLARDLTVIAASDGAARLLGRPDEPMAGLSLIRAVRDHDLTRIAREASGRPVLIDHAEDRAWLVLAKPVEVDQVAVVLSIDDRTELRRAQRARQELVGNLSHELRTPVAAARALAETLAEGVDEHDARDRFQKRLVEELTRLGDIVERLLSLSRLEGGIDTLAAEPIDPSLLIETARRRIAPLAERQDVAIVVEATPLPLPLVLGDRERVLEVLSNLLENALRASPAGGQVRMAVMHDDTPGAAPAVRFEVRDQGPGILPSERERVFERFYTGDPARSGPRRGTGLGLAIARHIVSRLGGRIWVADRHPGATLCFTLPLAPADGAVSSQT